MSKRLLKVVMAVPLVATSLWPVAALAYAGTNAVSGQPARFGVLLAYIDSGAGGFITVTVLGFISAVGYMARSYLTRLKGMVFKRRAAAQERKYAEER